MAALEQLPPERTLYAFDFDGTLAPIVAEPDEAFTLAPLRPLLNMLSKKAKVAIISGRGVGDVRERLHFPSHFVVGNHGLEGIPEFKARARRAQAICRRWIAQLNRDLAELPLSHGVFVEDKRHSLSLHFRHAKNHARMKAWLIDEMANLWPVPRVIGGKLIFNLVPRGSPHKGTALKALMKRGRCTHAVFVGDDVTDEDAFAEKGPILSVRVGRRKDSRAQFFIRDQNEMDEMLKHILRRLK